MSGASDGDERLSGSCSPDPVRSEQPRPRTLSRPVPVPPARLHRLFSLQGPGMARKFSAPGQLCVSMTSNLGGSAPGSAASATSLGHFPKSMCPPQQYGFPTPPFGTQWSGTGGPAPQPLSQFQPVGTASLQNFNISNLQKSISNPPGSNLRTT